MLFDHAKRIDCIMGPHSPERHVQAGVLSLGLHAQPGVARYCHAKADEDISTCKITKSFDHAKRIDCITLPETQRPGRSALPGNSRALLS